MSTPTLPIDCTPSATDRPPGSAIVFEDVHLAFEDNEVLRGVSFHLPFGETKALFGFIISTVGCYYGMTARGGTQGVGRATTQAVVAASVFILVTDFFVTKLLISILSYK